MMVYQQPLPLKNKEDYSEKSFYVHPSNQEAYLWIKSWPSWPAPFCLIYGEEGCGKTHLAHLWQSLSNAVFFDLYSSPPFQEHFYILENLEQWLITPRLPHKGAHHSEECAPKLSYVRHGEELCSEAIQEKDGHASLAMTGLRCSNLSVEETLFHFYNFIQEKGLSVLITSRYHPKQLPLTLQDLQSRLYSIPSLSISLPDEQTLFSILSKQLSNQGISLQEDALWYVIKRINRDYPTLKKLSYFLNEASLSTQKPLTIPFLKRLLFTKNL
ncbi:MAG: hypothetical protein HYS39_00150 [Proteobacteria bacterium]|nr:hypothetical protein [Pseudomonadota bacterium]